jgi:hypothetical protein
MGRADLEPRKPVECAFVDQMRKRDRGFQGIAYGVGQPAAAFQPRLEFPIPLWVDEDQTPEFFGLGPNRMKLWVGEFEAVDAPADRNAAQSEFPDAG